MSCPKLSCVFKPITETYKIASVVQNIWFEAYYLFSLNIPSHLSYFCVLGRSLIIGIDSLVPLWICIYFFAVKNIVCFSIFIFMFEILKDVNCSALLKLLVFQRQTFKDCFQNWVILLRVQTKMYVPGHFGWYLSRHFPLKLLAKQWVQFLYMS